MPKSQIIKDIVENTVPLEQSLYRLYVLAKDIKNDPLAKWAEKEINGYSEEDLLPDYRIATSLEITYSGINGNFQITNQPLHLSFIPAEECKRLEKIETRDGIHYVSELASTDKMPGRDLTYLAEKIQKTSHGRLSCFKIQQIIPQQIFQSICSQVKNKMINALLEMEKSYGNLDGLGIDIVDNRASKTAQINNNINNTVLSHPVENTDEKLPRKIAWNIIVPIITGAGGMIVGAFLTSFFGLS